MTTSAFSTAASKLVERSQSLLDQALPDHRAELTTSDGPTGDSILLVATPAERHVTIELFAGGHHVGNLSMSMRLRWRSHDQALVVDESRFGLFLAADRQPLVRFEFQDALTATPQSHWHFHAERGSFSALLSRTSDAGTGRRDPTRLASLHFPLGGPHFRPSVADVIEFVIVECGVDALPGWRRAVHDYRTHWRRDEAAATTRQFPAETAEALRRLGWVVRPPAPRAVPQPFVTVGGSMSGRLDLSG